MPTGTMMNLHSVMPEIILVVVASLVLLLDAFFPRVPSRALTWLSLIGTAFAGIYALNQWFPGGGSVTAFSGMIVQDNFGVALRVIVLAGTAMVLLLSAGYLEREDLAHGEYQGLVLFSAAGMMILTSAGDFISVFLGIETLSIGIYVLAGFSRKELKSQEASLKYFLLSSLATAVMVYGVALVYGTTGSTGLGAIQVYLQNTDGAVNPMFRAGMALVLAGLAFKAAIVPFHIWVPDVYEGAPTPVTAFMSFGTKAAAFAALMRVFPTAFVQAREYWGIPLWLLAALTMLAGNILAVNQTNLKRLLAWSSIGHAGYILIGVISTRSPLAEGSSSAAPGGLVLYLLAYSASILGALGVIIYLEKNGRNLTLSDYAGLARRRPAAAGLMALFLFSLAGIPPTGGFIAKFYVFAGAVNSGLLGLVVIGVLTSVIAVYYYLKVIVYMFMREPEGEPDLPPASPEALAVMILAAVLTLILGIYPAPILDLARPLMPGF